MNVNKIRRDFIVNIIIGIVSIIVFIIIHNIGYNFYYTNFIPRSRGISVGLTVKFLAFFVVIPLLLLSSFLRIKISLVLFVASSILIYRSHGVGSWSMPLRMLLIIVSYFCGICSIVFFRGGIKRLFYKIIEIKK